MENKAQFKIGDVVQYKSEQGPILTVVGVNGIYIDFVYWNEKECRFEINKSQNSSAFKLIE